MISRREFLAGFPATGITAAWTPVWRKTVTEAAFRITPSGHIHRSRTSRYPRNGFRTLIVDREDDEGDNRGERGPSDRADNGNGNANVDRNAKTNTEGDTQNNDKEDRLKIDKLFDDNKEKDAYHLLDTSEKMLEPFKDLDKLTEAFADAKQFRSFVLRGGASGLFTSAKDAITTTSECPNLNLIGCAAGTVS